LGENINFTKKNTQVLLDASKEVGVEVNVEKTESPHYRTKSFIKVANKLFGNVETVQMSGKMTLGSFHIKSTQLTTLPALIVMKFRSHTITH
jgi:hypothetical protein